MAYTFDFSPLNPIKFYPLSDKLPAYNALDVFKSFDANLNYRPFDQDFFYQNIPSWEDKRWYAQPYQQGDTIRLQWLGQGDVSPTYTVYLLDCQMNRVKTYATTSPTATTINSLTIFEVTIPLWNIPEAEYRLLIRYRGIQTPTPPMNYLISEPIDVRKTHDNSILVEYTNTKNTQGIIFEYGIKFQKRLYGAVRDLNPDSEFYTYEDEPLNMVLLSGTPYRNWLLQVGADGFGIPQYEADILNRVTLCDTLSIDSIFYTRDNDAKLEANKKENVPIASYSMKLRERYNDNSVYIEQYQKPLVMNTTVVGATYIYAHDMTYATSSTLQIRKVFNGYSNLIEYLNSVVRLTLSMRGLFAINENNAIVYVPGTSTEVTAFANITINEIYPYGLKFDIYSNGAEDFEFDYENIAGTTKYVVSYNNLATFTKGSFTATINTFNNTFAKGFHTVYIVVDDTNSIGNTNDNVVEVINVEGDLPPSIIGMGVNLCKTKYIGDLFRYTSGSFSLLQVASNNITSNNIDKLIKSLYDSPRLKFVAFTIDLSGQTPLAPPSEQIQDVIIPLLTKGGGSLTID